MMSNVVHVKFHKKSLKKINEKMKLENLSEEEKDIIEKAVEITFDALK